MRAALLRILILTLICSTGVFLWNSYGQEEKRLNALWLITGIFTLSSGLFQYLLIRAETQKPGTFVRVFMGAVALKLLVYIGLIVLYSIFFRAHAVVFIMGFLLHYLLFSGIEVISLFGYFRKKDSSNTKT
jgi:hypothetical protein